MKPRFGRRRVIGIWPPSKCGLPPPGPWWPARALIPLCPLPDVLPVPEPGPRPRRLRFAVRPRRRARGCAARSSRLPRLASRFLLPAALISPPPTVTCDEVTHLLELTLEARRDRLHHHVLMVLEADRLERRAHAPRVPDAAPDLLDANVTRFREGFASRSFAAPCSGATRMYAPFTQPPSRRA